MTQASSNGHASVERREATPAKAPVKSAVRELRQAAGISQSELARRLDVSPSVVVRWESRGQRVLVETIARVAQATGKRLRWVID